jgi:threonine synthase
MEPHKRLASDSNQPLERRLEAFEDIIDSDVGDTTLARARNIEREVGLRQIYLQFEGDTPTGTQKDRIAFAQAYDALRRGYEVITVATCGNFGAAIALASSLAGLRCIIYIPENYHTKRMPEMTSYNAEIIRLPGDYESAVEESKNRAVKEEFYDANPGGANTVLQLEAYAEIANEIYDELRDAPAVVAIPVSNGTTLAGIYKGFLSLYRRGKTSKLPRLVAGSSHRKNPIIQAFRNGLRRCPDLDPKTIRESPVNEPLINWRSLDGDHALAAIQQTGGWAGDVTDKDLLGHARIIREKQGLNILPASAVSLAVLLERNRQEPLPGDRYVVLLTGRRQ